LICRWMKSSFVAIRSSKSFVAVEEKRVPYGRIGTI
jgi:hypothetical protein